MAGHTPPSWQVGPVLSSRRVRHCFCASAIMVAREATSPPKRKSPLQRAGCLPVIWRT
jgi:hypothetical protein